MQDHSRESKKNLSREYAAKIFGPGDTNLRDICRKLDVKAVYRDGCLSFSGNGQSVERALAVIARLEHEIKAAGSLSDHSIDAALSFPEKHDVTLELSVPGRAGRIIPKTAGQEEYLRAIKNFELVFCIGPAGTGKTFLAVASAVAALNDGEVDRSLSAPLND